MNSLYRTIRDAIEANVAAVRVSAKLAPAAGGEKILPQNGPVPLAVEGRHEDVAGLVRLCNRYERSMDGPAVASLGFENERFVLTID